MTSVIVGGGFVFICYWHLHTPAYQYFTHTCTVEEVKSTSKVQSTIYKSSPHTPAVISTPAHTPVQAHIKAFKSPCGYTYTTHATGR